MQAVHQRTQLTLRLGQTRLLVQKLELVLALVGKLLGGFFGSVNKLQTLLLQHFHIDLEHKGTPLS